MVARIDVRRHVSRAQGVGTSHENRWRIHHVRSQACRAQGAKESRGRLKDLAPQMTALFLRSQLVFEVNARSPCFDHGFHELKAMKRATETCFRVSNDWRVPVGARLAFSVFDLIGAH